MSLLIRVSSLKGEKSILILINLRRLVKNLKKKLREFEFCIFLVILRYRDLEEIVCWSNIILEVEFMDIIGGSKVVDVYLWCWDNS